MFSLSKRFSLGPVLVLVGAASLVAGCGDDEGTTTPVATDSGSDGVVDSTTDTGNVDTGNVDTGSEDTSTVDTGSDTGVKDTGPAPDAGFEAGGAVPEEYFGVWAGNGFSYPTYTYPMIHVLTAGAKGEVIGWSAYPTYPCGGRLKLDNVSTSTAGDAGPPDAMTVPEAGVTLPNGLQVTEILEYGKDLCGDGAKQSFSIRADGKINWTWLSSSYFDTGTLTRVGDPGTDVPKAFWGVWRGNWTATGTTGDAGVDGGSTDSGSDGGTTSLSTDKLFIALTLGQKTQTVGAFVYEDSKCVGRWNLTASTATSLTITESVLGGACENGGTVTMTTTSTGLSYSWTKGGRTQTGALTRVTP